MQIDRMKKHLLDTISVDGDIIEFGVYKGNTFSHLVDFAKANGKMAHGVDSFKGMPQPTAEDKTVNNTIAHQKGKFAVDIQTVRNNLKKHADDTYILHQGWIPDVLAELPEKSYSFALIDLSNYAPTKHALAYIWQRMSYGGTLYFDNYIPHDNSACTRAINEFMAEREGEINVSRQMMINGIREKEVAIKCLRKELRPRNWQERSTPKRPIAIALVLKSGGLVYDHKYVNNLVDGIKSNLSIPHRIVCLTDNPSGLSSDIDDVVKFKHDWPKWWGKVELFRPDLFKDEQVFYFDLDTFVVDSLDELVFYDGEFCALRDFYHLSTMGSGFMSWHGPRTQRIYDEFKQNPNHYMQKFQSGGDQDFISYYKPSIEYIQDAFPNEVVSYKVHCKDKDMLPKNAKVVCFHGNPRPHEAKGNIGKYWKQ